MKKLIATLIFSILFSSSSFSNETRLFWLAGKFLNKIYTNYDVEQYLERAVLNDAQRGQLFEMAGKDYYKYKELVKTHTKDSFESGLKSLMMNKVLEHHATTGKNVREWKAFKISPDDFYKRIQELEDKVLKPLLDKGLGIVKSREQFGSYLVEQNFPHKKDETNTDVYFRWYKDQKYRLKHEIRTQEARRYEAVAAMGHRKEIYIRPTESNDFYKNGKRKIEAELDNKMMNQTQVSNYISKNPDLRLLIKDVYYIGLNSAPLSRILEESEEQYNAAHKQALDGITSSLTADKIKKIVSYEALAAKLAKKYNDVEKLEEKAKKSSQEFLQTGNYKDAMKARLYSIAASLVESKSNRDNIKTDLESTLAISFEELSKTLATKEAFTGDKTRKLLFEDVVSFHLKASFKSTLNEKYEGHLAKVLNLAAWVLEFDAKKISFNAPTEVSVEMKPFMDWDTQKTIQDHLKMKEFKKLMKDFKERKLRYDVEGYFSIDINGSEQLNGVDAYDWLISK